MTQAHPIPNVHASGSLAVEGMTSSSVALLCTRERTNQIYLRTGIDHPADAAQNAIHLAEGSESIDVNGLQAGGLRKQFLVAHAHPRNCFSAFVGSSCVVNLTQRNKNHALASSQIHARGMWSILHTASGYQSAFSNSSETSPDECATITDAPAPVPAVIVASNSGAA